MTMEGGNGSMWKVLGVVLGVVLVQCGAGKSEQETRFCKGEGFAHETDDVRMREGMQLERRGGTYDACVSHVACDNGKLSLSSRTLFCGCAISREYADCKD